MDSFLNCTICEDAEGLKRMNDFFLKQEDNVLTFIDAFINCFNLQFLEKRSNKYNLICEKCVDKLIYCCAFRKDVEAAHRRLYSALETDDKVNILKISETTIKIEYETEGLSSGHIPESSDFPEGFIQSKNEVETADDGCNCSNYDEGQNFDENSSDSDWSVKTDEIFRATGYWKELETIELKTQSITRKLDKNTTTCPLCSQKFSSHKNLLVHFKQHRGSDLCEICGKTYASHTYLYQHMLIHQSTRYKCTDCDKTLSSVRHLKAHMKTIHRGIQRFVCYVCSERFPNHLSRRNHLVMDHNLQDEKNHCPLCDYTWLKLKDLRKHLKEDHFDTWHMKCVDCSLVFLKPSELKRHLITHTDVKDHKCEICGKEFNRKEALKEHIKLHLNIKGYICNECNKAFSQKTVMMRHMKTHNKQKFNII